MTGKRDPILNLNVQELYQGDNMSRASMDRSAGEVDVSWFGEQGINNQSSKHNSTKAMKTTAMDAQR